MYGTVAEEHLKSPRNLGKLDDADGVGTVDDPGSETLLTIYLKVREGPDGRRVVEAAQFRAFGCGGCIITGSIATELATGRPVDELPALDGAALLTAIQRAKSDAIRDVTDRLVPDIERLQTQDAAYRSRIDNLTTQVRDLTKQRAALETRVDSLEGADGLPILAIISLAVLAGGATGFAMTWLARGTREAPGVTLSANPRGVDPV